MLLLCYYLTRSENPAKEILVEPVPFCTVINKANGEFLGIFLLNNDLSQPKKDCFPNQI